MAQKPSKAQFNTISMYKAKGIYPGAVKEFEKKFGKAKKEEAPVVVVGSKKKVSKKTSKKKVSSKK